MSKLKVAIVGIGGIAHSHIPGWNASDDADLVAAADIREDVLKDCGEKHGVSKLVTDPAELFADPGHRHRRRLHAQQLSRAADNRRTRGGQACDL